MENKNFSCACIIMASGQGKRFGSNKLMADFLGEPLIASILKVTENIFARRVIVTRHRDVENFCKSLGLEVVLHDKPHRNDTVRLGLEALEKNYTHYALCMCYQPLVKKSSLERLLNKAQAEPKYIWRLAYEEIQGTPVIFPAKFFEELSALPENTGGGYLLKKYAAKVRTVSVNEAYELLDIDTQEDLQKLLQIKEQ